MHEFGRDFDEFTDWIDRQDKFWPFSMWPPVYKALLRAPDSPERLEELAWFFLQNGLQPRTAARWLSMKAVKVVRLPHTRVLRPITTENGADKAVMRALISTRLGVPHSVYDLQLGQWV